MLPSLGFNEIIILGILALVVVGPKDLPLLFRKLGRWTAKLRGMAQEFRTGFDELARQAELDELKKEVDALRRNSVMSDINREISKPLPSMAPIKSHDAVHASPTPATALPAPSADISSPVYGGSGSDEVADEGGGSPLSQSASQPDSSPHQNRDAILESNNAGRVAAGGGGANDGANEPQIAEEDAPVVRSATS